MNYSEHLNQGNDHYLSSNSVVVLDSDNDALRHFLTHMHESLEQSLKIESERFIAEFELCIKDIISNHTQAIKDYINANVCDMIRDK